MKRILLFAATNIAVLLVISVVVKLLGLDAYLAARGGNLGGLLLVSAVFGFGGAFISLALSKTMARFAMGVQLIEKPRHEHERWLIETVRAYAERLGIRMHREFRADAGGARLAGQDSMIGALVELQRSHGEPLPGQMQAFGIHGGSVGRLFGRLLMSHPPLEERIAALRAG